MGTTIGDFNTKHLLSYRVVSPKAKYVNGFQRVKFNNAVEIAEQLITLIPLCLALNVDKN